MNASTIIEGAVFAAFCFAVSFVMAYLGTRSGMRLGLKHETARQARGPRIRSTKKRRALAEAIVQAREASIIGATQSIGKQGDELARHAALAAKATIVGIVGKRHTHDVFHRYVMAQARRGFDRSDRAHEAVHQRTMLEAIAMMPSPLLERIGAGDGPEIEMGCDGHTFSMTPDAAATEARRILAERNGK